MRSTHINPQLPRSRRPIKLICPRENCAIHFRRRVRSSPPDTYTSIVNSQHVSLNGIRPSSWRVRSVFLNVARPPVLHACVRSPTEIGFGFKCEREWPGPCLRFPSTATPPSRQSASVRPDLILEAVGRAVYDNCRRSRPSLHYQISQPAQECAKS